jgi:predicted GNAT family N-acyltransferase
MSIKLIEYGSKEWFVARVLRHQLFFLEHGLPESIMDDNYEKISMHVALLAQDELQAYGRLTKLKNQEYLISQMVVKPDKQLAGLGGRILDFMLRLIGDSSVSLIARLPATGFYAKFGFKPVGSSFITESTGVMHIKMVL